MNKLILEDITCTNDFLPFTGTRSVLDIRMGILTFREKWTRLLGAGSFEITPRITGPALPANLLPTRALAGRIREEASRGPLDQHAIDRILPHGRLIRYPWHIFQHNQEALLEDFALLTAHNVSAPIPSYIQTIEPDDIFIDADARVAPCILNASTGPIYIGKNAEIM